MNYYLSSTGVKIKLGEPFGSISTEDSPMGPVEVLRRYTLSEENVKFFIEKGIITTSPIKKVNQCAGYYIAKYCERIGWNKNRFAAQFNDICSVNPAPLLSILLKEIAIAMDKNHEGHILDAKEHYFVSLEDGCIHKAHLKFTNVKYIAIFRSAAEAEEALSILEELHRDMFPELYGEPENKECHSKGVCGDKV